MKRTDITLSRPRDLDLAYLAGIIDGEGHVMVSKSSMGLVLCMADIPILEWVNERFAGRLSGNYTPEGNSRPRRMWHLSRAADLRYLLPLLIPHLVLKHEEAAVLLEVAHMSLEPRGAHGRRHHPPVWFERREELHQRKMALTAARKVP